MTTAIHVTKLNPQKLWLFMTLLGILLLILCVATGISVSLKQNQTLVQNENRMLLRRNGELLTRQNIRSFIESLGLDERDYRLIIESEFNQQKVTFGKLDSSNLVQCSSEFYFQYRVQLCRPPPISWPTLIGISIIFIVIVAAASFLMRKIGIEIVSSFRELFNVAQIQALPEMNFAQAWATAFSMAQNFKDSQNQLLEAEKNRAVVDLSKQVAHDIRSPLSVLNILSSTLTEVSEEKRALAQQAIRRIDEIATELLHKSKSSAQTEDITDIIEQVIAEKNLEFQGKFLQIKFHNMAKAAKVNIRAAELSRILSNLINNSIEANGKTVNVVARDYAKELEIQVIDDGHGNFSAPKDGNGLGLSYARSVIEGISGRLSISSQINQGTQIQILIPKA